MLIRLDTPRSEATHGEGRHGGSGAWRPAEVLQTAGL